MSSAVGLPLGDIALDREDALLTAKRLAYNLDCWLLKADYGGAVAVAGGYVRDLACGREPKDLDIFLDGNYVPDLVHAAMIGNCIASVIGAGARVERTFASYGTWARDVEGVVGIEAPEATFLDGCPIPQDVDIVVLRPSELARNGFDGSSKSFLTVTLKRVDLRLNAIGATPYETEAHPKWDEDLLRKRLVVQSARLQPGEEGDLPRITKRLARLASDKFKGFTIAYEGRSGELFSDPPITTNSVVR